MPFDLKLKADTEIFEKMRFISVNDEIILKPTLSEYLDGEIHMYYKNSSNSLVKEFLPEVFVNNEDEAREKLLTFIQKSVFRASLFYAIRLKSNQVPIGYIHLNSPLTQSGLDSWTVDYWLNEGAHGKGIMTQSLGHMLHYLQQYQVPEMKALVKSTNISSINVLKKLGFRFIHQEEFGEQRYLYSIKLN